MSASTLPEAWANLDALATDLSSWEGPLTTMNERTKALGDALASRAIAGAAAPSSTAVAIAPPVVPGGRSGRVVYD